MASDVDSRIRVLIVDDDAGVRGVHHAVLGVLGFACREVGTGAEALDAMRSQDPPEVVMLDLEMPDVGGAEVLRRMDAEGIRIPVLVVTGHEDMLARLPAWSIGVQKPVQVAMIPSLLRRAIDLLPVPPRSRVRRMVAEVEEILDRCAAIRSRLAT